ncbi:hypothetical protein Tco_0566876 [Tanacetum coccineum]
MVISCQCFLFKRCPNLEVLYTQDKCGDTGLQVIGQFCKKLRRFIHYGRVTHIGLTDLAQGCYNLEYLDVNLLDISNEVMECIGTHLKNLRDLRMDLVKDCMDLPLDNGIRAMLTGCNKLERLDIHLFHGGLTDVGLGYIGKYCHNLVYLSLKSIGESDAGLVELSKGCPKLRKLKLKNCPFSEQAVTTLLYNILSALSFVVKGADTGSTTQRKQAVMVNYHWNTTQRKQAVMVIGVDGKPSNEALKKIDEIPAVEEFVFRVLLTKIEQCLTVILRHYVHDVDDRKLFLLFAVDCMELDGSTRSIPRNHITPWIKEIAVKFSCLKELQIRGLVVDEEDLETLATSRGKDLRVLKINKYCRGSWEEGLVHVAKFKYGRYDVQDLTILARKCSKSLVSLKIHPCSLSLLGDTFRHALRLEDFSGACYRKGEDYSASNPPNMRCFGSYDLHATGLKSLLLPLANQLKELNLQCLNTLWNCCCFLVKKCPNLEVLYTEDGCGDMGMQVIGLFCKKLRKFTHAGCVTHMGLIALALGCHNLEYINVSSLRNISNEAMECIGTNLKNLRHFSVKKFRTDIPLENGIRAMLTGCNKLERLDISFRLGGLTDVGLGYIGKYGHNLKYLSLECLEGLTDAGLVEFSKGCPQLRTLRLILYLVSKQFPLFCLICIR